MITGHNASFFYKGFKNGTGTLLHIAILEKNVMLVKALIKMGANTLDTTSHTLTIPRTLYYNTTKALLNLTSISLALCVKNPEVLTLLLKAPDVNESIGIKCYDTTEKYSSPFELAVEIAKETVCASINHNQIDRNTILVSIIVYILNTIF